MVSATKVTNISPALKRRAAKIKVVLMDVDGTLTDGSVTLLSEPDGSALEIKTFDAHDGQGRSLAHTAGLRTHLVEWEATVVQFLFHNLERKLR